MSTPQRILLYDDYCPLCSWYSNQFVKLGLLKAEDRIPFSKADISILTSIDIEKGKDEIPFYDTQTGTALYGIDALLEILGSKCAFVKTTGRFKPIYWFLKKLYKFISYNRKVIVAKKCGPGSFDCSPVFNIRYRLLFIALFLVFNSVMLIPLHDYLLSRLSVYHLSSLQLQSAHFGFVLINCLLALFLGKKKAIEYLGQVNMLALVTILALSLIALIAFVPEIYIYVALALLTWFVITEYFRRMRYANILGRNKYIIITNLFCLVLFLLYVFH